MSRTQAFEFLASHLMENADAWLCEACLAQALAASSVDAEDASKTVRHVVEELDLPGFERGPQACARCGKAALVAVRYVRSR